MYVHLALKDGGGGRYCRQHSSCQRQTRREAGTQSQGSRGGEIAQPPVLRNCQWLCNTEVAWYDRVVWGYDADALDRGRGSVSSADAGAGGGDGDGGVAR